MVDGLAGQYNPLKKTFLPGITGGASGQIEDVGYTMGNPYYPGSVFNYGYSGNGTNPYSSNPQRANSYEEYQVRRAQSLATNRAAEQLVDSVQNNRSTKIPKMYKTFCKQISEEDGYKCLKTEEQKQAYILNRFENITGARLEDLIDQNAHGSFVSGLYNTLTLGIAQDKSADSLKEELFGQEAPTGTTFSNGCGRIGGGAVTGAAIGALCGGAAANGAVIGAACGGGVFSWATAGIGAAIGAAAGLVSWIWS